VPLLVGHNRDEWRLMLATGGQLGAITDAMATTALQRFGPGPDPVDRMRAAYPDADDEELLVLACSDHDFRMPSLHLAAAHTAERSSAASAWHSEPPIVPRLRTTGSAMTRSASRKIGNRSHSSSDSRSRS
jgi:hypothetical protein